MKILILGLGTNGGGLSAALYFAKRGKDCVRVSDSAPRSAFALVPDQLESLGVECHFSQADPRDDIKWADIVIKNPAVPQSLPQLSLARRIANDFSFLFSSPLIKDIKLIAVTGTKGKSTTVAAVQHGLNELGQEALICGNIGISAFSVLEELEKRDREGRKPPLYIVMEMSSWQIHDTYVSLNGFMPRLRLAILTSVYADHLNSYNTMREYYEDKLRLFGTHCEAILVNENDRKFFLEHTFGLKKLVSAFPGYKNPFREKKMELQCAYSALRILGLERRKVISALSSYKGMPHRIEQVALYKDLMFVNDSAATIAEAVTFTMKNLAPLSTHLICGGTDKNLSGSGMLDALQMATSVTLLDGSFTRNELLPMMKERKMKYSGPFDNMKDAFDAALEQAVKKRKAFKQVQCILLSPGAASFELFKNEFDRCNQFKFLVKRYIAFDSGKESFPLES